MWSGSICAGAWVISEIGNVWWPSLISMSGSVYIYSKMNSITDILYEVLIVILLVVYWQVFSRLNNLSCVLARDWLAPRPVYVNARIGKGVTGWYCRPCYSLCTSMLNSALLSAWACRLSTFYGCFRFNAFYRIHVFTLSCDINIFITLWYVVLPNALRDVLLLKMNVSFTLAVMNVYCVSKETSVRLVVGPFRINIRISLLSVILNVTFYLLSFKPNCDTKTSVHPCLVLPWARVFLRSSLRVTLDYRNVVHCQVANNIPGENCTRLTSRIMPQMNWSCHSQRCIRLYSIHHKKTLGLSSPQDIA